MGTHLHLDYRVVLEAMAVTAGQWVTAVEAVMVAMALPESMVAMR